MTRRGARQVTGPGSASEAWRDAARGADEREARRAAPPAWEPEEWIDAGPVRDEASKAVARGVSEDDDGTAGRGGLTEGGRDERGSGRRGGAAERARDDGGTGRRDGATGRGATGRGATGRGRGERGSGRRGGAAERARDGRKGRQGAAGDSQEARGRTDADRSATRGRGRGGADGRDRAKLRQPGTPVSVDERLAQAARSFERERYADARRVLATLVDRAPNSADARELYGLTLYRLGRWREAIRELRAFHDLTGSFEQHPVLADCHRAMGRHREVDELWADLKAASPSQQVMIEGRIVAAGSLADRGDVAGAVRLLQEGPVAPRKVGEHHLRLWYALADLHERVGDLPRARELFGRVVRHERDFVDVAERLANLE